MSKDYKVSSICTEKEVNIFGTTENNTLKSLNISENVEIGPYTCLNCTALEKVSIPSTAKKIGYKAFFGCASLKDIVLPNNVTEIQNYAFGGCISLVSINLPKSITFIGNDAFSSCSENLTFLVHSGSYAHEYCLSHDFNFEIKTKDLYTVTFLSEDGFILQQTRVRYGEDAIFEGDIPQKDCSRYVKYKFKEWSNDITNVTSDLTITPVFNETKYCSVIFYDTAKNNVLWEALVEEGEAATIPSGITSKIENFAGWDKDFSYITKNTIINTVYPKQNEAAEADTYYTVRFYNYDLTLLHEARVIEGGSATYDKAAPTKESTRYLQYKFAGWDMPLKNITKNTDFIAVFNETKYCSVIFYDTAKNNVLWEDLVEEGEAATIPSGITSKIENFAGWDKDFSYITKNTIINTMYETQKEDIYYTARFYNYDLTLLYETKVLPGQNVLFEGDLPTREDTNYIKYSFVGWDTSLDGITKNTDFIAVFEETYYYLVTFNDTHSGNILSESFVKEGEAAVVSSDITEDLSYIDDNEVGYFMGWDKDFSCITENIVVSTTYDTYESVRLGDNVAAILPNNGLLRVVGLGNTYDFAEEENPLGLLTEPVTNIVVDNGITSFPHAIFAPFADTLESLTVPFVGKTMDIAEEDTGNAESTIGWFFGTSNTEKDGYSYQQFNARGFGAEGYNIYSKLPANLTYVEITNAKIIPFGAFWGLSSVKNIKIADGAERIYGYCFYGCWSMEELTVPFIGKMHWESIYDYFYDSNIGYWFGYKRYGLEYNEDTNTWEREVGNTISLSAYNIDESTRFYYSKSRLAYCGYYYPKTLTKVTVTGDGMLPSYAFSGNDIIEEVYASKITKIGEGAFGYTTNFNTYDFSNVKTVERLAFIKSGIKNLDMPMLKEIGSGAFCQTNFETVTLTNGMVAAEAISNKDAANYFNASDSKYSFDGENLDTLYIASSDIEVKDKSISTSITNGITSHRHNDFNYTIFSKCEFSPDINYKNRLNYYAAHALYSNCNSIKDSYADDMLIMFDTLYNVSIDSEATEIVIPDGVKAIASYAFCNTKVTKITIPDSVEVIEDQALVEKLGYSTDYEITEIVTSSEDVYFKALYVSGQTFRDSQYNLLKEQGSQYATDYGIIKDGIFYSPNPESLELTIPEGVTEIAPYAFYKRSSIAKITLPSTLQKIGYKAFYNCPGLSGTTVAVPGSIKSINMKDSLCFGSTKFAEIIFEEGVENVILSNVTGANLYFPNTIKYIGGEMGASSNAAITVTLPRDFDGFYAYAYGVYNKNIMFCDYNGEEITSMIRNVDEYTNSMTGALSGASMSKIVYNGKSFITNAMATSTNDTTQIDVQMPNAEYISTFAFSYRKGLTNFTGDNVRIYNNHCFQACSKINCQVGEYARLIGDFAFNHTGTQDTYMEFYIPEHLCCIGGQRTDYGYHAACVFPYEYGNYGAHTFYNCGTTNFKEFAVNTRNQDFISIDGVLYTIDKKRLVAAPKKFEGSANYEAGTLAIEEGVERIDELGLGAKQSIKTVILPDSYTIREEIPSNCINLWANTLTAALYFDSSLDKIEVKETNPRYKSLEIVLGYKAIFSKDGREFWAMPNRTTGELILPRGLTAIRHGALGYDASSSKGTSQTGRHTRLTKLYLPATLYNIDDMTRPSSAANSADFINEIQNINNLIANEVVTVELDAENRWYSIVDDTLTKKELTESAFCEDDMIDVEALSLSGMLFASLRFARFVTSDTDSSVISDICAQENFVNKVTANKNNMAELLEKIENFETTNTNPIVLITGDNARFVVSHTVSDNTIIFACYSGEAKDYVNVEIEVDSLNNPTLIREYLYGNETPTETTNNINLSYFDTEDIYITFKDTIDNASS